MRLFRLFKKDVAREATEWVRDGIIEPAQAEAILSRYGAKLNDAHGSSVGYYVLTALATLFVGLSLILIVSHNWDEIPRLTRMLGIVGLTLAVNLQGARLLLANRYRAGVLWLLFGSISYGMAIMLIAQIYHLGEHYPDGIFYWALGILPLVFITQSRLIALLVLLLATIWMWVEASTRFFPAGYPVFALAALWLVWSKKDSALLFLGALAGLVMWFNMLASWAAGDWQTYHVVIDQVPATIGVGLLLAGFAWWLMRQPEHRLQRYGQILHLWLLRGAILTLLFMSYEDFWWELAHEKYLAPVFTLALLVGAAIGGYILARPSGKNAATPLLANAVFFTFAFISGSFDKADSLWLAVGANLMLLFTGIWLIRRGIDDAVTHFFYTGVGVLLLTALLRYFDLIGDYIGGALLFLVAAGVLFAAAHYWRKRTREAGHA